MDPLLSIEVTRVDDVQIVEVAGELDIASAPELAHALGTLEPCNVTVDLARVTFVDSSGLRCLLEAHQRMRGDGSTLSVRGTSPIVRRTFEVTGLDQVLLVETSRLTQSADS
jgi:anti-sigma B factor antagonist